MKKILIFTSIIVITVFACKKEKFFTDNGASLTFSVDTIQFDTVFTTIGSATQNFKVYNPYNKPIKISSISLAKGDNSFFRLNVNGVSARSVTDIELDANDSIYIFVEVRVNPNNTSNPLMVQDSIVFITNGTVQDIDLIACGQDVNFINGEVISSDTTWTSSKPFLVYNSMLVDSNVTLTISQGTKIYFHHGSRMYVKGTLKASGSPSEPIVFRNDRLEHWYDDVPGQWVGIYFYPGKIMGSKDNELHYCEIKNAIIGIQADTNYNVNPTVTISNTKILNMNAVGIFGQGTNILAWNCVIANCGQYALALTIGGNYEFHHCTIYNSWQYANRQTPSLVLNNYYQDNNGNYHVRALNNALFENCIIYGGLENEIGLDAFNSASVFNYKFKYSLLKIADNIATTDVIHWDNVYKNHTPGLKNPDENDFSLDTLAYTKDKGFDNINSAYFNDILGNYRFSYGLHPDLGAYERLDSK
ncbi:MAG: right-handed parallel beta-helix repeat-containing protein [Bacteroidia bacterium]|nr:right-handed parallel beta-helix repeat-containing protein [Bacteroidia bacterium]